MSLPLIIYLAELSSSLRGAGLCLLVIFFLWASGSFIFYFGSREEEREVIFYKTLKKISIYSLITLSILVIIPSRQSIYMMAGFFYAGEIAQDVGDSEVFNDALGILSLKLKEIKSDLEEDE